MQKNVIKWLTIFWKITRKEYQILGVNSILDTLCEIEVENYFYLVILWPLHSFLLNLKLSVNIHCFMLYVFYIFVC